MKTGRPRTDASNAILCGICGMLSDRVSIPGIEIAEALNIPTYRVQHEMDSLRARGIMVRRVLDEDGVLGWQVTDRMSWTLLKSLLQSLSR